MFIMKIKKYKYLVLLFFLFAGLLQSQVMECESKPVFIERFIRFIEWPNGIKNDVFKIAVVGDNPFDTSLDELFAELKIKDKPVEIIYTNDIKRCVDVNIVFISNSETEIMQEILAITNKYPILTIGDSKGFCDKGVHINMYIENDKIRYEINQDAIQKSGLKVSSLLLSSAKIVKTHE